MLPTFPSARRYGDALTGFDPVLSFMSVAEMRSGALIAGWGRRRTTDLEEFIRRFRVVFADDDLCFLWAKLRAHSRAVGREISVQDAWIAATAIALDATLATDNRRDYEHIPGLELLQL